MRFKALITGATITGLAEQTTIATDTSGGFIYGFTEAYSASPNVQATAFSANSPVQPANMLLTNSLTATIGTVTTTGATVNGVNYPLGYVSGKVFGAASLNVAGINLVALTTLSASVNLNLMVLGA